MASKTTYAIACLNTIYIKALKGDHYKQIIGQLYIR